LGCNLVVLARECSLKEIERMVSQPQPSDAGVPQPPTPFPLEVFVHGALCVAYSGQCLTSEALGGRSANRGECAQACRLPYELLSDGQAVPLGDRKYLLSPQDLAGLEVLPELVRLGVASLKIEGRLKSPEYVANITRIYRNALDVLAHSAGARHVSRLTSHASALSQPAPEGPPFVHPNDQYEMEMSFSRGLYTGWFRGVNNQALVHGRFGKKRGVYLGQVQEVRSDGVTLNLEGPLKPGDGVVFDAGRPEDREEGGRVYEVFANQNHARGSAWIRFGRGDIEFSRVHVGDRVWKTSDPELDRRLRKTFKGDGPRYHRPIEMEVHGRAGQPMTLIARDELGRVVRMESGLPLLAAEKQPLTGSRLREQLGRLGGTPFQLAKLENHLEGPVLLPLSELNLLRREAVAQLQSLRARPARWILRSPDAGAGTGVESLPGAPAVARTAQLVVMVRNLAQLEAAVECGLETIYCDFEDPKKYREAVTQFRIRGGRARQAAIFVTPPRVFKMGEEWTLKQVRSCEADGYLVRNYDHLRFFAQDRRIGDYSLNVANRMAAEYFKKKFGLERLTASYDLNISQLEALLRGANPDWFEITIHQHMPMFHMEHCLFCAFLSQGTDYTNCGRPCDRHDLKLRDRVGAEHPVKADVGCRNTVFNGRAQTGADYVGKLLNLGVRHFRIEFVNEDPGQVTETIGQYRQLLRGEITGQQLWRRLNVLNQLGVTRGPFG
jgi:putative protease